MKPITRKVIAFLSVLAIFFTSVPNVFAAEQTYEHIQYVDNGDGTATITKGDITKPIPEVINGLTVTRIGEKAFYNQSTAPPSVKIPDTVVEIDKDAFMNTNISELTLSANLEIIGPQAFYNAKLTSVELPNKLKYIGEGAFWNNQLTEIVMPDSVEIIGKSAFAYNKLQNVVLPKGLEEIPDGLFRENELISVNFLHEGIKRIGSYAFKNNKIRELKLPESLERIGYETFLDNKLINVVIPKNVSFIAKSAFSAAWDTGYKELWKITILSPDVELVDLSLHTNNYKYLTIYGFEGSTAESYANKYGLEFIPLDEGMLEEPEEDNTKDNEQNGNIRENVEAKFNLSGGLFSLTAAPIHSFGDITLTATPQKYSTSFEKALNVKDLRGTHDGWRLDVSATQFEVVEPESGFVEGTTAHKLPKGTLTLKPLKSIQRVGEGQGALPTSQLTHETIIDDGVITVAKANQGEGTGVFDLEFPEDALSIVVDATTAKIDNLNYPDGKTPYVSTITWELVSAP